MLELHTIDNDNFAAVLRLEVADGQDEFVASNLYTLAEAYVALTTGEFVPRSRLRPCRTGQSDTAAEKPAAWARYSHRDEFRSR